MNRRTPSEVIDEYLVIESQAGKPEAFHALVARWQLRLLRQAFRYTHSVEAAKDVTQESWMAIVKGLNGLHDATRFRPWAYRIVANKARDWVRREGARRRATAGPSEVEPVTEPMTASGAVERLREGIRKLEIEQQLILTWFHLEDMPLGDIAEALSIPIGTVKSRLFHARAALRAHLMEES